MRFKNRYFVFELLWRDGRPDDAVDEAALLTVLRESLLLLAGDAARGAALASLTVKWVHVKAGLLVLRCGRGEAPLVWAALTLLTHLRGRAVLLRLLHQGGTLASVRRGALECCEAAKPRLTRHLGEQAGLLAATQSATKIKNLEQ